MTATLEERVLSARQEWFDTSVETLPADFVMARQAITELYEVSGMRCPRHFFTARSPLEASAMTAAARIVLPRVKLVEPGPARLSDFQARLILDKMDEQWASVPMPEPQADAGWALAQSARGVVSLLRQALSAATVVALLEAYPRENVSSIELVNGVWRPRPQTPLLSTWQQALALTGTRGPRYKELREDAVKDVTTRPWPIARALGEIRDLVLVNRLSGSLNTKSGLAGVNFRARGFFSLIDLPIPSNGHSVLHVATENMGDQIYQIATQVSSLAKGDLRHAMAEVQQDRFRIFRVPGEGYEATGLLPDVSSTHYSTSSNDRELANVIAHSRGLEMAKWWAWNEWLEILTRPIRAMANSILYSMGESKARRLKSPLLWSWPSAHHRALMETVESWVLDAWADADFSAPDWAECFTLSDFWGQFEAYWLSFYCACVEAGVGLSELAQQKIACLSRIARSCAWWYPFVDAVIITDRPREIHWQVRDATANLHHDGGAAVSWRDGWSVYALEGIHVPARYALLSGEDMNPREVITISNADLRAVLVRKIGPERLLDELDSEIIDTATYTVDIPIWEPTTLVWEGQTVETWKMTGRSRPHELVYKLILLDLGDRQRYPYLHMVNPSTGEIHLEGMHPQDRTVADALIRRNRGVAEVPLDIA